MELIAEVAQTDYFTFHSADPNHTLSFIFVEPGEDSVWVDIYGGENKQQSVYSWITPDSAETLGLALIHAARRAREARK